MVIVDPGSQGRSPSHLFEAMEMKDRFDILLARFRFAMVDCGAKDATITDAELISMLKADTTEGRLEALEKVTSLVPAEFWRAHGL
jgi:hypothetical protein